MWLECIRYRFRLDPDQDCLELAQEAALQSLRHSPRCRSWRVLPSPSDPSLSILEIEWDAGPSQAPFRGSEEFAALHAALTAQVRALDEADYRTDGRTDGRPARRALPGPDAIFRLAEDIVTRVMRVPELAGRFHSRDGSRRARLGLWLVEVLGGPALFSSNFSGAVQGDGPLAGEPLDLDERERFLEVAQDCLPSADYPTSPGGELGAGVLGTLRANLPLYPAPPDAAVAGLGSLRGALNGSLSDELYLGDELLVESERLLDEAPPPRGYLPAPVEGDDESSGPPTSRGLGPRGLLDTSSEPPSSGLETRAAGEVGAGAASTRATADTGPRERDGSATWTRRRLGRRYRAFDSGVFTQARRQTAKR
jgi:hypothetical protein